MDKNTVIGFILIGLVLMIWLTINTPPPQPVSSIKDTTQIAAKSFLRDSVKSMTKEIPEQKNAQDTLGKYFSHLSGKSKQIITIETENYYAEVSSIGGSIQKWILKKYRKWDQYPIDLVSIQPEGNPNLIFYTTDGKLISTKKLNFEFANIKSTKYEIGKNDSVTIELNLNIDDHSKITKIITFYGNSYSFDVSYRFVEMKDIISNFQYQIAWDSGIQYTEHNSIDETNSAKALIYAGGELTEIDAKNFNEQYKDSISGRISWAATRTKYFTVIIIPVEKETHAAYLEGVREKLPDEGAREKYNISLEYPYTGRESETVRFIIYLGPLDFDILKKYNIELEKIISLGAAWIIRPISEYIIIPLFKFLRIFIPNYGFVLIVFSFIIKIVLHPLTKSSMKSMQKMQALQPMMNEIREKYKDDPQKMNQQIMRLYKEYGVNPAGGCLPLLLQLPILYALWAVFSSAIELRQAAFILWIKDLSIPDVIARLPFRIPIFNINEISGLALLMGITMFVQQKMSVKDPRQKMMVWMMPLLLTLMFNAFPSGLNLYYFVFNLLSIVQQAWITKKHKNEPLRKVEPKKSSGGWISKIAKELPTKPKH